MSHNPPPTIGAPADPQAQPTLGELIARICENLTGLIQGEIALAKAKAQRMFKLLALGVGILVAAAVLALYALGLLLQTFAHALAQVMPLWAGYLIIAAILAVIVAVLAAVGIKRVKGALQQLPAPQTRLKQEFYSAKDALQSGLQKGKEQ